MQEEYFIDIKDYEGLYQISNYGRIKNVKTDRILKSWIGDGYLRIHLYKNPIRKNFKIHRLLAIHFIPNPNNYSIVDHTDRNKLNNDLLNLRWVNQSQNCLNKINYNENTIIKGINFCKFHNLWRASWTENGKNKFKSFIYLFDAIQYRHHMVDKFYDKEFYIE